MEVLANRLTVSIAKDFSETPGPRYIRQGSFSGEAFREQILAPRFKDALEGHGVLTIDLDGAYGYGTSFLEESFGGLARIYKDPALVLAHLELHATEEPDLIDRITKYINEAKQ